MRFSKGFSLIELLITLVIIGIILSAAYFTYTSIFRSMKEESESTELQIEKTIGLEILRLDLEHIGYGIAKNVSDKIIEWDNGLKIRSTLNNSNLDTLGWVLCQSNTKQIDERENKDTSLVFIDTISGNYISISKNCPSSSINTIFIGFPISSNANSCDFSGTKVCNTIIYTLSKNQDLKRCNKNTKNLLRKVNDGEGIPILSCVADFAVSFDIDNDNDSIPDRTEICRPVPSSNSTCTLPENNTEIRNKIIRVNFYALVQEGGLNKDYYYTGDNPIIIDNIELKLPDNYEHYRWKVIKLSVKPLGMFGGKIGAK